MATFHEAVTRPEIHLKSEATTAVPSENVSNTDFEKERSSPPLGPQLHSSTPEVKESMDTAEEEKRFSSSQGDGENKLERVVSDPRNPQDDEVVYPGGLKLFIITLALCLSVLLVALDRSVPNSSKTSFQIFQKLSLMRGEHVANVNLAVSTIHAPSHVPTWNPRAVIRIIPI